jgi:hypothetical protein
MIKIGCHPGRNTEQGESCNYLIWYNLLVLFMTSCINNRRDTGKINNFCHILSHLTPYYLQKNIEKLESKIFFDRLFLVNNQN